MSEERQAKQIIVMRTDLNMRKGKMIAQGAHASIAFLTHAVRDAYPHEGPAFSAAAHEWIENSFTKICVRVDSEEELLDVYERAKEASLEAYLITDKGLTEFGGVPTHTCVGIGPNWAEDIDKVTGELKLL